MELINKDFVFCDIMGSFKENGIEATEDVIKNKLAGCVPIKEYYLNIYKEIITRKVA